MRVDAWTVLGFALTGTVVCNSTFALPLLDITYRHDQIHAEM
jgi:hypothetical protein